MLLDGDDKTKMLLKSALIKQQLERLDLDLAKHVVLSALSLDSGTIFKSIQLMSHLQMMRYIAKDPESLNPKQLEEFEAASQEILPETYLDRAHEKPQ